jgi:hypothetical protein
VIPTLTELAAKLGVNGAFLAPLFAALITGLVFLAQSVVGWFEDRNP